jgi:hypothetical protein
MQNRESCMLVEVSIAGFHCHLMRISWLLRPLAFRQSKVSVVSQPSCEQRRCYNFNKEVVCRL